MNVNGLTIDGRSDLYVPGWQLVADLKTVNAHKFAAISDTVNRAHRLQVAGYALAARQSDRAVRWVAWMYLDRSSGAEYVVVEPFDDELVALVEQRCEELVIYAASPEVAPRDERGPGLSVICDGCPWLRECWGPDAEPGTIGAQRVLCQDNAGVTEALRLYDEARARESQAREDKEFARAMFSSYEPGSYGPYEFGWTSGSGQAPDKDAAVALLEEAGIPVPRKAAGRRLVVRRTRSQKGR